MASLQSRRGLSEASSWCKPSKHIHTQGHTHKYGNLCQNKTWKLFPHLSVPQRSGWSLSPQKLLPSIAGTDTHRTGCDTGAGLRTVTLKWSVLHLVEVLLTNIVTKDMIDKNNGMRHRYTENITCGDPRGGLEPCAVKCLRGAYQSLCVDATTLPLITATQENPRHPIHWFR